MTLAPAGGRSSGSTPVDPVHQAVPILVVDDNATKRLSLRAVLAPLGFLVVEAESGAAALRCLFANDFAVILLDVQMPVMDGFETAALIRLRRQSEMTPIVFVTAHAIDEVAADVYAQGAVDFITTPVSPVELRAKVSVFANLFLQQQANDRKARDLQSSTDQLRLITDTAPIGIFQTDAHNRYIYTNARFSEITGIPAEVAAGEEWHVITGEKQRAALAAEFRESADPSEFSTRLSLEVAGDPSRIVLLTSTSLVDAEGGISGWVGTLADITAEVGAEAAMTTARDHATAASQLKSDFLANMSHEIRTPMNGVIGLTELLLDTELDDQQRDLAETLSKSGESLMTVINGVLDFAKIEGGMLEVEDIEFSMRTLVDDVVDLLAPSAMTKGLELTSVIDDSVPAVVSGDPSRLRQVLTNLAGNAIKFTQTGTVVIRTVATETTDSGIMLRFELSDSGIGIAPDKLAMIFEPFTQADTSTTREYGGTGLGLAISSQLVALLGGEIGLSSELGVGSTFWFTARVRIPDGLETPDRASTGVDIEGLRALIVDVDPRQRAHLSGYLTAWGMTVSTAVSIKCAVAEIRAAADDARPVDVVFIDHSPHRREGAALEAAILAEPGLTTRVVTMIQVGHFDDLADVGGDAFLTRPIRRGNLRVSLREAFASVRSTTDGSAEEPAPAGRLLAGRLLLAEDNFVNQKVAVAILTKAGYQVDTARNGREAVRAAASQPYDAILMDCHMPQMNGYQATAAIRAREGSTAHTPIIAITAGARSEDEALCLKEGMDDYVAKPISAQRLLGTIRHVLDRTP